MTAAIYSSRGELKTLIIAGNPGGGQLLSTTDVENFPGFPEGVLGPQLIELFKKQALRFGAELVEENVSSINGSSEQGFVVKTETGNTFGAKSIILATGASAKWLGLDSEQKLRGKGVSACATCDGYFFKGKVVAVVGSGDAAMEESLYLTKFAPKVYVVARCKEGSLRASKIMAHRALVSPKIEFLYTAEVLEVIGENKVEGLKVINNISQESKILEDVEGLFVAIGHKPNTDFLLDFVELDAMGYIRVLDSTHTSKEGVFVAGDAADFKYRQAVSAAGYGCMAAMDAEKFLSQKEHLESPHTH